MESNFCHIYTLQVNQLCHDHFIIHFLNTKSKLSSYFSSHLPPPAVKCPGCYPCACYCCCCSSQFLPPQTATIRPLATPRQPPVAPSSHHHQPSSVCTALLLGPAPVAPFLLAVPAISSCPLPKLAINAHDQA